MTETIYALSSAPGKAGVSVVRVSGPDAPQSLSVLTRGKIHTPRQAHLSYLYDGAHVIDHAMVVLFAPPASFTGETVVEYHLHGSRAVIDALFSVLATQPGHRLAEPGEFTRRAFENGKMDLTKAEAIADLIDAETQSQKDQALQQMSGALSELYEGWRERLIKSLAYVEAIIDFPDEDIPDSETAKAKPGIVSLCADISAHLNDNRRGERLRDGLKLVVIGAPNAGKSSLVNLLAERDVAIVSDISGTTRDVIDVPMTLAGYPVILSDTAGLRPEAVGETGHDKLESEGIKRARARAQTADIKILVFDGTMRQPCSATFDLQDDNAVILINKKDQMTTAQKQIYADMPHAVFVSAYTQEGMSECLDMLSAKIKQVMDVPRGHVSLTRARHREALTHALDRLSHALNAPSPELMAEDLRLSARALGRITGRVDVEDLLDVIFRDFCIGK